MIGAARRVRLDDALTDGEVYVAGSQVLRKAGLGGCASVTCRPLAGKSRIAPFSATTTSKQAKSPADLS